MIHTAITRPISTLVLVLGLALFGATNLARLPVDFLPDITYPLIKLSVQWSGATPEDIDRNLADPIERQLAAVDGLDSLSSSAMEGLYQLDVTFRYGVDVDTAYQDVLAAFARAQRDLPEDIEPAIIIKADPSQLPVVQAAFESSRMDLTELRTWIDNWLTDRLLAADGVAGVDVAGGLEREIRVLIDHVALEKYSLSLGQIERRLSEENLTRLGGRVTGGNQETIVRTLGEYTDLETIRDILIARTETGRLRLRDIARVEDGHEEMRIITRLDGRPAVKVNIIKQADANTVETVRAVRERLAALEPAFPAGMQVELLENQAEYIEDSIAGVRNTVLEAALLVVLTVFAFLGNLRQVVILALVIPITLAINVFVMRLAGFSLNIFSLGGMVISIGIMLDAATIVIENITRLRREQPTAPMVEVAWRATTEVGSAVTAAILAFVALFLPFLLVPGLITLLFKELVLIILSIIGISLAMALFLVPTLAALLLRRAHAGPPNLSERMNDWMRRHYGRSLGWVLGHRWVAFVLFMPLLVGGVIAFQQAGGEFLPAVDDGRVMVKVRMPAGAALERLDRVNRDIEALVSDDPRVASVFALTGGAVRGLYTNAIGNEGQIDIELVPVAERDISTTAYIAELRPKVAKLLAPGASLMVMQKKLRGIRQIGESEIEVEINGADIDTLFQTAQQVAVKLGERAELTNVHLSLDYSKPEWQVDIDRVRAAELGLTVSGIADTLRGYIGGHVPTRFRDGNDLFDLRVLVPERTLASRSDVEDLVLAVPDGGFVRLREVATVTRAAGPVEVIRKNQVKQVIVRADTAEVDLASAQTAARAALAEVIWPTGYAWTLGGKGQQMAEMQTVVREVLILALFFSFLVLAVQFNSLRLPFVVFLAAPFCVAGIGYALLLGGQAFGATVIIAVMVVLATNVNDGVLLIETAQRLRAEGMERLAATREAAELRLRPRPRLMITLPVSLGFVPLAFAFEPGGDLLRPLAVAAIGGLLAAVLVALYLVPVLYSLIGARERVGG